jgi:uncharacterized protein (TIGR03435 family)
MKILPTLILALLCARILPAQAPASNEPQKFAIASIRQNQTGKTTQRFGATPNGYQAVSMALAVSILLAYPPTNGQALYPANQVLGLPSWAQEDRYDIDARIDPEQLAAWQAQILQQRLLAPLLQNLLVERCQLKAHREQKVMATLALVVTKNGPKFTPSRPDAVLPAGIMMPGGGVLVPEEQGRVLHFYRVPVNTLAVVLSHMSGQPVIDKTGLAGNYDISFDKGEQGARDNFSNWTFEAVERLGLKLVSQKNVVEFLVIDHIERPSEN